MIKKVYLLLSTVKHLKLTQIRHQIKYRLNKTGPLADYNQEYDAEKVCLLNFLIDPPVSKSIIGKDAFEFLNLKHQFENGIDWNFQGHGKLWNYNLQYGNYLLEEHITTSKKIELLNSLQESLSSGKLPLEPYPISLRVINCLRLFSKTQLTEEKLLNGVHAQLDFLSKRPEYHLLGNHLLENAFALMLGGAYFTNLTWLNQGKEILKKELEEQILDDGAHFELSVMYHQIVLFRLLELIDWYNNVNYKDDSFDLFIRDKAIAMLSWLSQMTFHNGDIPHFNDSAIGIAYSSAWLQSYAQELNVIAIKRIPLKDSGYRTFTNGNFECRVDCAVIGPSYQPGHGHADALSFILYVNDRPLMIEQGTSTYQIGARRTLERSTEAHNTVLVNGRNQSDIWSGFRVGKRAKVTLLKDTENRIEAEHDGYNRIGLGHKRSFEFDKKTISIIDKISSSATSNPVAYFHFHPDVNVSINNDVLIMDKFGSINFIGATHLKLEQYNMADGYNQYRSGKRLLVSFDKKLQTEIQFL